VTSGMLRHSNNLRGSLAGVARFIKRQPIAIVYHTPSACTSNKLTNEVLATPQCRRVIFHMRILIPYRM
jgi:hypothetical protein